MQDSMVHSVPSPLRVSARKRAQKSPSGRPTAKRATGLQLRSASAGSSTREVTSLPQTEPQSQPSSLLTVENLAKHQKMTSARVPVNQTAAAPATRGRVKYRGYETKGKSVAKREEAVSKQVSSSSKSVIRNIEDMMAKGTATDSNAPSTSAPKKSVPPPSKNNVPPPSEPMTRNQTRRAREAKSPRLRMAADPNPTAAAPAMESPTTYIRSASKAEKIRKLLEKRERKKERQLLAASSASGKYRGYNSKPSAQAGEQPVVRPKFSEAEVLGGFKKVVRPDGTVVKIPVASAPSENARVKAADAVPNAVLAESQEMGGDQNPPKKAQKLAQTSQDEQALMAELFKIADSIEEPTASTSNYVGPTASTSNNTAPTASQGFETGPRLDDDDFPTFEDLF